MVVGVASGGGGRQLAGQEGHTWWCGAQGVVKAIGEGPERAVHGGLVTVSKVAQGW
jgi:hypothetical protein